MFALKKRNDALAAMSFIDLWKKVKYYFKSNTAIFLHNTNIKILIGIYYLYIKLRDVNKLSCA